MTRVEKIQSAHIFPECEKKNGNLFNRFFILSKHLLFFTALALISFPPLFVHAAFDPTTIPGLTLWLRADTGVFKDLAKTQPATVAGDSIAVWADQSGQGNDLTQTTPVLRPQLAQDNSQSAVFFPYPYPTFYNFYLNLPNGYPTDTANNHSFSVFVVYQAINNARNNALLEGTSTNNFTPGLLLNEQNNSLASIGYYDGSLHTTNIHAPFTESEEDMILGTSTVTLHLDDQATTFSVTNRPGTGGILGAFNTGRQFEGTIKELLAYNAPLSATQLANLKSYLYAKYAINPNPTGQVIFDGDSITAGFQAVQGRQYPWEVMRQLSNSFKGYNIAVPSETLITMLANGPTKIDPLYNPGLQNNVVVIFAGTNDLALSVGTGTTTYNNLVAYSLARKAAGFKVVVVTMLERTIVNDFTNQRHIFNNAVRANWRTFADGIADIAADSFIGTDTAYLDTNYFVDGIHPTSAGHAIIAGYVTAAIKSVINPSVASGVIITPSSSSATVVFSTDVAGSTFANFGPTSAYGTSTREVDIVTPVTNHTVVFPALLPKCTTIHFQTVSNDVNGHQGTSSDQTFTTTCTGGASVTASSAGTITTSAGGSLSLGNISLTVPTSFTSTSSSTFFQAKQLDANAFSASAGVPANKVLVGNNIYNLEALIDATTTLSTFSKPLTVIVHYAVSDLSNILASSLKIYRYDGSQWSPLNGCIVDSVALTVTCQTSNFSDFGLFGDALVVAPVVTTDIIPGTSRTHVESPGTQSSSVTTQTLTTVAQSAPSTTISVSAPVLAASFGRDLKYGMTDDDVLSLQQFLNTHGFTLAASGPGSSGNETSYFGSLTKNALIKFQEVYGDYVLKPLGLSAGTGYFGISTRTFIQSYFSK